MSKRRSGFTLVELLVVIGIIAVLISILLPALSGVRWSASNIRCAARMRDVTMAVIMYANDNKGFIPPLHNAEISNFNTASSTTDFLNSALTVSYGSSTITPWPKTDNGAGLGRLYRTGYLKTSKVFVCPSAKTEPATDTDTVSQDYYVLNPHVAFFDSVGPTNLNSWWRRLPNYGRFNGTGLFRTGAGTNTTLTFTNWPRAILTDPLYSYNSVNNQENQTHRLGTKRAINMAYPDGSCRTLVIGKFTSHPVSTWYQFLDLSNAVQDSLNGASVNFMGTNWINYSKYGCVPIVPDSGN